MTGQWSRAELEEAFQRWHGTVSRAAAGGDWHEFVELFTPDATYHEQMFGELRGHDAIWAWVEPTLAQFPGLAMTTFPTRWHLIDDVNGVIVAKVRNVMRDPGDGSVMEADNISVLTYAGDGLFSSEEDVYDPAEFISLIESWGRRAMELGTLDDAERAWYVASYGPTAP